MFSLCTLRPPTLATVSETAPPPRPPYSWEIKYTSSGNSGALGPALHSRWTGPIFRQLSQIPICSINDTSKGGSIKTEGLCGHALHLLPLHPLPCSDIEGVAKMQNQDKSKSCKPPDTRGCTSPNKRRANFFGGGPLLLHPSKIKSQSTTNESTVTF